MAAHTTSLLLLCLWWSNLGDCVLPAPRLRRAIVHPPRRAHHVGTGAVSSLARLEPVASQGAVSTGDGYLRIDISTSDDVCSLCGASCVVAATGYPVPCAFPGVTPPRYLLAELVAMKCPELWATLPERSFSKTNPPTRVSLGLYSSHGAGSPVPTVWFGLVGGTVQTIYVCKHGNL